MHCGDLMGYIMDVIEARRLDLLGLMKPINPSKIQERHVNDSNRSQEMEGL